MTRVATLLLIALVGCGPKAPSGPPEGFVPQAEVEQLRAEADEDRSLKALVPKTISGSIYDGDVDEKLFATCAQIPDTRDARNSFLWAQKKLWEIRESPFNARHKYDDVVDVKHCVHCWVHLQMEDEFVTIKILPNSPPSGD